MVSSALDMTLDELLEHLGRMRGEYAESPAYQRLRADLPADWPL